MAQGDCVRASGHLGRSRCAGRTQDWRARKGVAEIGVGHPGLQAGAYEVGLDLGGGVGPVGLAVVGRREGQGRLEGEDVAVSSGAHRAAGRGVPHRRVVAVEVPEKVAARQARLGGIDQPASPAEDRDRACPRVVGKVPSRREHDIAAGPGGNDAIQGQVGRGAAAAEGDRTRSGDARGGVDRADRQRAAVRQAHRAGVGRHGSDVVADVGQAVARPAAQQGQIGGGERGGLGHRAAGADRHRSNPGVQRGIDGEGSRGQDVDAGIGGQAAGGGVEEIAAGIVPDRQADPSQGGRQAAGGGRQAQVAGVEVAGCGGGRRAQIRVGVDRVAAEEDFALLAAVGHERVGAAAVGLRRSLHRAIGRQRHGQAGAHGRGVITVENGSLDCDGTVRVGEGQDGIGARNGEPGGGAGGG